MLRIAHIILFFILLVQAYTVEIPSIRCSLKYYLEYGKPGKLIFNSESEIKEHDCRPVQGYGGQLILGHFKYTNSTNVAEILRHDKGIFDCYFVFQKKGSHNYDLRSTDRNVSCQIEIAHKFLKKLKVYINDNKMKYSEPSTNDVDAETYYYYYVPDEFVKIKLKKSSYLDGNIHFDYVSNFNHTSMEEATNDIIELHAILKAEHNMSYVDFKYIEENDVTSIRVYLVLNTHLVEDMFLVNGVAVRTYGRQLVAYKYNEKLPTIICREVPALILPRNESVDNPDTKAVCNMQGRNATIKLYQYTPCNGIFIGGLEDNKILFRTCQNRGHDLYLYYAYADKEQVSITCTQNRQPIIITWYWSRERLGVNATNISGSSHNFTRRMLKNYDLLNITCSTSLLNTYIIFKYVGKPVNIVKDERKDILDNPGGDPLKKYLFPVGGSVLAITLVCLIVCVVIALRKRQKQLLKSNGDENTQVGRDGLETQIDKRKNEDTNNKETMREMEEYAAPVDVKEENSAYSVPYKPTIEEMYTKPLPKNKRNNNEFRKGVYRDYSEVVPKNMLNSNNDYAEISSNEHHYSKVNSKIEISKFDHENTPNNNKYVEPVYCEVRELNME